MEAYQGSSTHLLEFSMLEGNMNKWCDNDFYDPRSNKLYIGFFLHIQTASSGLHFKSRPNTFF